jgi:hypothetical protein
MLFSSTRQNDALASATAARLKADARIVNAKAALFRICGYSVFVVSLGIGLGLTSLGFYSVRKAQSSSDEIGRILVNAFSRATIRTKGQVTLAPGAVVSLRPDTTVTLDPNASVRAQLDDPISLKDTRSDFNKSSSTSSTKYTISKEKKFLRGAVITDWMFTSSEAAKPDRQRCYYAEHTAQNSTLQVTEVALDRRVLQHASPQINIALAATNCVWFDAQVPKGESR